MYGALISIQQTHKLEHNGPTGFFFYDDFRIQTNLRQVVIWIRERVEIFLQ